MSKKNNTRNLLIIFLVLLAAVVISQLMKSKNGDRSFKKELVSFSEENINSISLFTKANQFEEIRIEQENGQWLIKAGEQTFHADQKGIINLIGEIRAIRPERLAATQKEKWENFEISDSLGSRIVFRNGSSVEADIVVGKLSYNNATRKATSYVRAYDAKNVYAIEGFLAMSVNRDINSLRDRTITNLTKSDIKRISFNYPGDGSFVLSKDNEKWMIGNEPADSVETAKFINSISRLNSGAFIDKNLFNTTGDAPYSLSIEGNNLSSVQIKAFPADTTHQFAIVSSANPGTVFGSKQDNLFGKLFISKEKLK